MTTNRTGYPIFDLFTLDELADQLGVTVTYLAQVRDTHRKIGPQAKGRWARILQSTVKELFNE